MTLALAGERLTQRMRHVALAQLRAVRAERAVRTEQLAALAVETYNTANNWELVE